MLKRYQVLMNEWLADHIKKAARKYDISFSETVRILLCLEAIQLIAEAYPEKIKLKHSLKDVLRIVRQRSKNKIKEEEFHQFLSQTYFETRKAIETWEQEEKKRKG